MNIGETLEGPARYPINLRYPREWRDSLDALKCRFHSWAASGSST